VLIFTDSQVSIQLLNRILRRPGKETGVHKDLLLSIAKLILDRARNGRKTSILKVKSHIGIAGNEAADKAAKRAADSPDQATLETPASHPFRNKWWPAHTSSMPQAEDEPLPTPRAVSNLGKQLKATVRQATKLGSSNRDSYYVKSTQQMYTDPTGAHPSSNAYLGSKCTHSSKHLTLKARTGVLFTQARAALLGLSSTTACPLCGSQDSIGHMLGHCAHSAMRPLYISRHDQAVIHLYRALQKGADGGNFTIIDAGKMQDVLNKLAANGKRLPPWLLPGVDPDTLRRMRPDILRITGLPAQATHEEIAAALLHKSRHKIQVIELGYCSDFNWKQKLEEKKAQHQELIAALREDGWEVEEHYIVLGTKGTIYKDTLATLQQLGLAHKRALALMATLNIHAVTWLATIVTTRRREEQAAASPTARRGVG
jgi:hypothetical protein